VLITGAAGFIGSYTVREFVAQGWHVLALLHRTRAPELEELQRDGVVTLLYGDMTDPRALRAAVTSALQARGGALDAIVHCAGRASDVGWSRAFRTANYASVVHLGTLALELGVARFVFVSTTDVYGLRDFAGEGEDELPLVNNTHNPYPHYKIAAEQWVRATLPADRYALIRPAAVWGVGDKTLTPRAIAFLRTSPWMIHFGHWRGRNRWPLAHVRNVAMGNYLAATQPEAAGKAINILDSEHTSIDEFYHLVAEIFLPGKSFGCLTVPRWLGQIYGGIVSCCSNLCHLDHPCTDPSLYALYSISSHLDFSNQRFRDLLATAARTLVSREAGLAELRNTRH
jgi:nucleoside-diphosphate-sugar epimerase